MYLKKSLDNFIPTSRNRQDNMNITNCKSNHLNKLNNHHCLHLKHQSEHVIVVLRDLYRLYATLRKNSNIHNFSFSYSNKRKCFQVTLPNLHFRKLVKLQKQKSVSVAIKLHDCKIFEMLQQKFSAGIHSYLGSATA